MIQLYKLFTSIIYFLIYPIARFKAARGDRLWRDRLALDLPDKSFDLWLHAASVGEVKIMMILIDRLLELNKKLGIFFTTVTPAGYTTAVECAGDKVKVAHLPLDSTAAVKRALDRIKPKAIVIAETEIWPNLVDLACRRKIPLVLVNGRMTAKAHSRYRKAAGLFGTLLSNYNRLFLKTEEDAQRYLDLIERSKNTIARENFILGGDMKFDAPFEMPDQERIRQIRLALGANENDFIFVAGSTRPGEEAILTALFADVSRDNSHFRMVIAPRHLERIGEIKGLFELMCISFSVYGETTTAEKLVLVDQMGILSELYQAADLAFVGGTMVGIGGHNLLEPVWAGTPVLFGPYLSNVRSSAKYLVEYNYGAEVATKEELTEMVKKVISGQKQFRQKSNNDISDSATVSAATYILDMIKK